MDRLLYSLLIPCRDKEFRVKRLGIASQILTDQNDNQSISRAFLRPESQSILLFCDAFQLFSNSIEFMKHFVRK